MPTDTKPDVLPPATGQFFFTDLLLNTDSGSHYIDILTPDQKYVSMSLNTQMEQIGLFSRSCKQCHAPDKQAYKPGSAKSQTSIYHATDKASQA